MKVYATIDMNFEAAHKLVAKDKADEVNLNWYGKCSNLHGHNYKIFVTVQGDIQENGMILNFVKIKDVVREKIIKVYDHVMINDLFDEIPTAENMCLVFWKLLDDAFLDLNVSLYELKLYETENSCVTLRR